MTCLDNITPQQGRAGAFVFNLCLWALIVWGIAQVFT